MYDTVYYLHKLGLFLVKKIRKIHLSCNSTLCLHDTHCFVNVEATYFPCTMNSVNLCMQADVYTDHSGGCVAFLANIDSEKDKVVTFRNRQYDLPAWSVSILPDCKNVVFNTAKVFHFPSSIFQN
jgi:hypothetical protein